jgi:hypothetical protein
MYFKFITLSILSIFFVVASSGCILGNQATPIVLPSTTFMPTATQPQPTNDSSNEYILNFKKWRDANILHYRFQLTNNYQGSPDRDTPVIIEVEDGKPISIISLSGGMIDGSSMGLIKERASIDLIFEKLKHDFAEADDVSVTYDSTYGYPAYIYIDSILEALDDEESWMVTEFEVLP